MTQLKIFFLNLIIITSCANMDIKYIDDIKIIEDHNLVGKIMYSNSSEPVSGVVVSDGYTATKTNENGIYQFKRNANAEFVFYSIPNNCNIKNQDNTPMFYSKIDISKSIFRADFVVEKIDVENNFIFVAIGDPQVKNSDEITRFKSTIHDIDTLVASYSNIPCYGMALGDLVNDKMTLFGELYAMMGKSKIPYFKVIGNHDYDYYVNTDNASSKIYTTFSGPLNYSFNRGKVHFVVMDNIIYTGRNTFIEDFTHEQLDWLKQDLSFVPNDNFIAVCVHAPTYLNGKYYLTKSDLLYKTLQGYNFMIFSAHKHYQRNEILNIRGAQFREHNHAAASGNYWRNADFNRDGTPLGYAVYEFDGNKITNDYFKCTGKDIKYQMRIYPLNSYEGTENSLLVNIFNYDFGWKTKVFEDGTEKAKLIQISGYDPYVYSVKDTFNMDPQPTNHLFQYTPINKTSKIRIEVTDQYGNIFEESVN